MTSNASDLHVAATDLLDVLSTARPRVVSAAVAAWRAGLDCPQDPDVAEIWQTLQRLGECIEWEPGEHVDSQQLVEEAPQVAESARHEGWAPERKGEGHGNEA